MKIPGPDHPITIDPTEGHVTVSVDGIQVAASDTALSLAEAGYPVVQYVPLVDVDQSVLRDSDSITTCPYKGNASYYSLAIGDTVHPDAVWRYATPHDAVAEIAGTVAFDTHVATVEVTAPTEGGGRRSHVRYATASAVTTRPRDDRCGVDPRG